VPETMARTRTFRLSDQLLASLQERARDRGESANALAERLLEEGLRRDAHPLIDFREGAAGRRPALVGTRLDVAHVVDTWLNSNKSVAETVEYFQLPERHIRAALQYYAAFQEEVDEWRTEMHEFAEREEAAWRREQALLK
jgi:uncharacterized protein (DUF433 family)